MAHTPDKAVADTLDVQVTGLTAGTNLFDGPVSSPDATIPHKAVFCLSSGGPAARPYLGASNSDSVWTPRVQVRVRSDPDARVVGETLARDCLRALQDNVPTGYVSCRPQQSEPEYLGQDSTNHHEWSFNVLLEIEE